MTENIFEETIRKEKARLSKAASKAQRAGDAILAEILDSMRREHPGWDLKPTSQDELIVFENGANKIFLNLVTGKIGPGPFSTEISRTGFGVLFSEVRRKKKKWLRVRARFEKALTRARSIGMLITQDLDEIKKSIPAK